MCLYNEFKMSKRCVSITLDEKSTLSLDLTYISYPLVCQTSEEIHPGPEHQRSQSVDEPDEENDPDRRMSGSALRTVEVSQRNRCRMLIPIPLKMNITPF